MRNGMRPPINHPCGSFTGIPRVLGSEGMNFLRGNIAMSCLEGKVAEKGTPKGKPAIESLEVSRFRG